MPVTNHPPAAGDVVSVSSRRVGEPPRLGEIIAVLGEPEHTHYTVRWEDGHESILYPGAGTTIRARASAQASELQAEEASER